MRPKHMLIVVALLLSSATSTFASVSEVRLYVEGLACPFCTFGIEKSLKKVPGVVSLETTIRTGLVRIEVEPGVPLDPTALNEAVKRAGFTPSRVEATITGKLSTSNEHPALASSGNRQTFRLVEPGPEGTFELLAPETLEKLKLAAQDGSKLLAISGRIHSHAGIPPALAVENFEVAE